MGEIDDGFTASLLANAMSGGSSGGGGGKKQQEGAGAAGDTPVDVKFDSAEELVKFVRGITGASA